MVNCFVAMGSVDRGAKHFATPCSISVKYSSVYCLRISLHWLGGQISKMLVFIPSLTGSHYIIESWLWNCLAEHQLSHCLDHFSAVKLNVHRVRKTRDATGAWCQTRHLAVYLWEVSLTMDFQAFCLYKRNTGVYFCFTNIVTKEKVHRKIIWKYTQWTEMLMDGWMVILKRKGNQRCLNF